MACHPGPAICGCDELMTHLTRRNATLAFLGLAALPLGGCLQKANITLATSAGLNEEFQRGFIFDDDLLAKIKPGMDVQAVLTILGTPSTTSTVGNRTFYYINQTVKRTFQFQNPRVIDQRVVAVYFNKGFKVERIANWGLKDGVIFDFISRSTPTGGAEQSFLGNMFKGVTKLNPFGS
jgi:outer membrane protein assembly factor BamE (lipoprotein component of BamABCDE complex)